MIKDVYTLAKTAELNTALYMEEQLYFVKNKHGMCVLVKAWSWKEAVLKANLESEG